MSAHETASSRGSETTAAVPRAAFDVTRLALASGAGAVSAAITAVIILVARDGDASSDMAATCLFAFSAAWSIAYLVHTLRLFGRLPADRLRQVLRDSTPRGRFGSLGAIISGTGPTIAVQWSLIAVAAVLAFTVWPSLLKEPVTVVFSILVVAASCRDRIGADTQVGPAQVLDPFDVIGRFNGFDSGAGQFVHATPSHTMR